MLVLLTTLALSLGQGHSCALMSDGTVRCWGGLDREGLREGRRPAALVPTPIAGLTGVVDLSAGGGNRTCAIRGAGEVWCWELDQPPERIPGLQAVQISVGNGHTCAVKSTGHVACWGYNSRGQLGDGTTEDRLQPVEVVGLTDATQVSAGYYHSCARRQDGTVRCWGMGKNGQLGNAETAEIVPLPVDVLHLTDAAEVHAGSFHTCALRTGGGVACWGSDLSGQLGDGNRGQSASVVAVKGLTDAVALDVGMDHGCVLRASGALACWGSNEQGQLGNTDFKDHLLMQSVDFTGAVRIATGAQHSCAARDNGDVFCWGGNYTGQLGDGTQERHPTPTAVR